MDAFAWVSKMRKIVGRAPIAVVAENTKAEHVIALLDAGADDVVIMPAAESLVRARAHALLRCTSGMYPASAAAAQLPQASPDISLQGQDLRVHGVNIQLTATEAALVSTLLEQRRQWRTANELLERTFDTPASGDTSLVRVHIFNIRRKLGGLAYCIQGRRRYGYRIL
jgi:DNA-binding response OmpR family regulator